MLGGEKRNKTTATAKLDELTFPCQCQRKQASAHTKSPREDNTYPGQEQNCVVFWQQHNFQRNKTNPEEMHPLYRKLEREGKWTVEWKKKNEKRKKKTDKAFWSWAGALAVIPISAHPHLPSLFPRTLCLVTTAAFTRCTVTHPLCWMLSYMNSNFHNNQKSSSLRTGTFAHAFSLILWKGQSQEFVASQACKSQVPKQNPSLSPFYRWDCFVCGCAWTILAWSINSNCITSSHDNIGSGSNCSLA